MRAISVFSSLVFSIFGIRRQIFGTPRLVVILGQGFFGLAEHHLVVDEYQKLKKQES